MLRLCCKAGCAPASLLQLFVAGRRDQIRQQDQLLRTGTPSELVHYKAGSLHLYGALIRFNDPLDRRHLPRHRHAAATRARALSH
jgi:hypothetical protein